MNRIDGATAGASIAPRQQDDPRGTSFSRHQTWMREFEKAHEVGRIATGPSARQGAEAEVRQHADAASPMASASLALRDGPSAAVPSALKPADAFASARAMPDVSSHTVAEPPPVAAPHAAHMGAVLHRVDGVAGLPRPATPGAGQVVQTRAEAVNARREVHGQAYADHSAQVYRQGDQLSLVLRDVRLSDEQGDAILKALIGRGLPAGIRRISVTLNGHTRALQLQDPGA
jgi:hypothetical protein